jgi:hypothetical protein
MAQENLRLCAKSGGYAKTDLVLVGFERKDNGLGPSLGDHRMLI